jgi:CubicO group peptidase (beta-lactamase class C family)
MMGNSILSHKILRAATLKTLWTPTLLNNGELNEQNYAIGWRSGLSEKILEGEKVKIVHHGGTASGSTSFLILYPEHKIVVSILINKSGFSPSISQLAHSIAGSIILNKRKKSDTTLIISEINH